jgi:hypothetical protein
LSIGSNLIPTLANRRAIVLYKALNSGKKHALSAYKSLGLIRMLSYIGSIIDKQGRRVRAFQATRSARMRYGASYPIRITRTAARDLSLTTELTRIVLYVHKMSNLKGVQNAVNCLAIVEGQTKRKSFAPATISKVTA